MLTDNSYFKKIIYCCRRSENKTKENNSPFVFGILSEGHDCSLHKLVFVLISFSYTLLAYIFTMNKIRKLALCVMGILNMLQRKWKVREPAARCISDGLIIPSCYVFEAQTRSPYPTFAISPPAHLFPTLWFIIKDMLCLFSPLPFLKLSSHQVNCLSKSFSYQHLSQE